MTDIQQPRIDPLRAAISIVDDTGRPTPDFIRRWEGLRDTVDNSLSQVRQAATNQQSEIIRILEKPTSVDGIVFVRSAADLAPYLTGDAYVLPNKLIIPIGTVDLADKALEMSTGTVINGLSKGTFMSSNASGVLRATPSVASAVIVHNTNFVATAGPVLDLEGPSDQQLNLDFVGMFGPTAGSITGYQVSSVKTCFIDCADGITFDGTTRKIFIQATPFYSITGSAVRLAATLVCDVVHIESCFFKYDLPGIGIEAVAGYSVGYGLFITSLKDGTVNILSGLTPADTNWIMENNQGFRDSSVVGSFAQSGGVETTTISATSTPTLANLTTAPSVINERFLHANNRLTYDGQDPVTVLITASASMGAVSPNQDVLLWIAVNGTVLPNSRMTASIAGAGARDPVSVSGATRLNNGDYIEIFVENITSTSDITMLDTQLTVGQSS